VLRLKFLRLERGLSQHQLAVLTNVRQSELSRIETGRGIPTTSELTALATVLECAADRLMDIVSAEVSL
jgi:transcriptional regulator with XRE-family HTH domain